MRRELLRQAATNSGTWTAERDKALKLLDADARRPRPHLSWAWGGPVLVDVLLDDGDLDAAWAAARGPIGQFPHRVESWH